MHEDMRPLLNAYLDGELHGMRLLEMQTHLASCAACRRELKELRQVSDLLHASSLPEFKPADRFVADLTLRLPRRTLKENPPKPGSLLWWVVPACLIGIWFFLRTAFTLTNVIATADLVGLLGQVDDYLAGSGSQSLWVLLVSWLSGGQAADTGSLTITTLGILDTIGTNIFTSFLGQVIIVALYWVWLAAWWLRRRPRPLQVSASPLRS